MLHLDLMTWLIIAVAFLFLLVANLGLVIYENRKLIKLVNELLSQGIESQRKEIVRLEIRLEEVEHHVDPDEHSLPVHLWGG